MKNENERICRNLLVSTQNAIYILDDKLDKMYNYITLIYNEDKVKDIKSQLHLVNCLSDLLWEKTAQAQSV